MSSWEKKKNHRVWRDDSVVVEWNSEDLSSVSDIYMVLLTDSCNPVSRGAGTFF